jgi:hypothetical protein
MIDVFTFDSYISYSQLHFEEETLDKLTKIQVSPSSAIRNIQQLQNQYAASAPKHTPSPVHIPRQIGNMGNSGNSGSMMPKTNIGLQVQRRFGMRAMFM